MQRRKVINAWIGQPVVTERLMKDLEEVPDEGSSTNTAIESVLETALENATEEFEWNQAIGRFLEDFKNFEKICPGYFQTEVLPKILHNCGIRDINGLRPKHIESLISVVNEIVFPTKNYVVIDKNNHICKVMCSANLEGSPIELKSGGPFVGSVGLGSYDFGTPVLVVLYKASKMFEADQLM